MLARALRRLDVPVWVTSTGPGSELRERMARLGRTDGVREVAPDGPWPTVAIAVDALLGTGASGAPRPAIATLLQRLMDLEIPILAIDGPTGVDLLSGIVHGSTRAEVTVTFGGLRRGHLLARDEVGVSSSCDIGHPPADPTWPAVVTDLQAAEWLPRLRARDHKGTRGRVVVVGGAPGMTGAIRMAARSAFAAGAGLVHAVAPAETVAALVQAEPDLQTFAHSFEQPPSSSTAGAYRQGRCRCHRPGSGPGFRASVVRRGAARGRPGCGARRGWPGRLRRLGGRAPGAEWRTTTGTDSSPG